MHLVGYLTKLKRSFLGNIDFTKNGFRSSVLIQIVANLSNSSQLGTKEIYICHTEGFPLHRNGEAKWMVLLMDNLIQFD